MSEYDIGRGSFAGHETFTFRYMWLRKAVAETEHDTTVFSSDDAMVRFGVGKNMVRSIRHWGLATGMLEEDRSVKNNRGRQLQPSDLGRLLFADNGLDPYFEDPGTLWLIHWNLASTFETATAWYWVYNHIPQFEFSKQQVADWMETALQSSGKKGVSSASLKRDVDCFIKTYVPSKGGKGHNEDTLDCPLVELGLVREFMSKGNFLLERGEHPSLPNEIFAYALMSFLIERGIETKTIPLDTIAFELGSPGNVFCLSEDALLTRLERLRETTDGRLVYDDTAGLRQISVHGDLDPVAMLFKYYDSEGASAAGGETK